MRKLLKLGIILFLLISLMGCCSSKGKIWLLGDEGEDEEGGCNTEAFFIGGSSISKTIESGDYGNDVNESILGVHLGASIIMPLNPNIRLETGIGYASKGSKSSYSSEDGEGSFSQEDKLNLSYLELPIVARYQFNNTGFSAYGGIQPAFLLGAKQKSEATGSPSQDIDVKDNFKSFDTSAIFGIGYEFKNGLMINAGYDLGLLNIAEKTNFGNTTVKNRAFKLSLGYKFKI